MLPSSLLLPHLWNFFLPLPAPDRISRFRARFRSQSFSLRCFCFHKILTASSFRVPAHCETANLGPAPRRGIPGPCPPKQKLCPPSEDCAPKKLTGLGLLECKSCANRGPNCVCQRYFRNFCGLTLDFMTFLG